MAWVNPVKGRISGIFGDRKHPVTGVWSSHGGTDIAAVTGTPVVAAAAGRVSAVGATDVAGKYVQIDHGGGIVTRYHHLSVQSVKTGDQVKAGQVIGKVGATGRVTGAHLHFEVRVNGTKIDAAEHLASYGVEIGTGKNIGPRLEVDGHLGPLTIRAWQAQMGTPVDGVISRPSLLIRSVQKHLNKHGARLVLDGHFGPLTIRALQTYLGTKTDGFLSKPSAAIRALQRRLNKGEF